MELTDSFVRLTWDPDGAALVLVDYGDPLWSPVELDGRQVIQQVGLIRAAGMRAIPRGNETHNIKFTACVIEDAMDDAFAGRLTRITTLPRAGADVLISLEDGRSWRLKHCAVQAWPGGQEERLTRETVEILGGDLTPDDGAYVPGAFWQADTSLWES